MKSPDLILQILCYKGKKKKVKLIYGCAAAGCKQKDKEEQFCLAK
uniref:Uncharacterized protein n=1 Tax=Anguilla anguilla TaxID=7936 RepID=A0A0E9REV2_ANGAN